MKALAARYEDLDGVQIDVQLLHVFDSGLGVHNRVLDSRGVEVDIEGAAVVDRIGIGRGRLEWMIDIQHRNEGRGRCLGLYRATLIRKGPLPVGVSHLLIEEVP